MTFAERVVEVHRHLTAADLPHAFGGALSLDYYGEPRGTVDVDVNVFLPAEEVDRVLEALAPLGLLPERGPADRVPIAGIRLVSEEVPFPVDVFPSLDEVYEEIARRVVVYPFGPERTPLPFLSAEDLVVFKLSFGRSKDWVDLASVARSLPDLDVDYVQRQVVALRGPSMHPRVARLRSMLAG